MCRRDFQERSDVFERKEVKKVGVSIDKVIVSFLWCLDIQVNIAVIDCGVNLFGGVHYNIAKFWVIIHAFLHFL